MKQKSRGGGAQVSGSAAAQQHALGVYGDDVIEIVDGNSQPYASSDGEGIDDGDDLGNGDGRKDNDQQYMDMSNEVDDPPLGGSRRNGANKINSQRMQLLNQQLRVTVQGQ